jgi:hypothetical protein
MTTEKILNASIPPRRYLSREEAAAWLGVSVDSFSGFVIPYCDFGPRLKRWDIVDIEAYAEQNKAHNSARTSAQQKGRQACVSTDALTHQNGGLIGQIRKVDATAKALGLTIKS